MSSLSDKFDQLCEDMRIVKHIVTGNGTPERGMVVRLDRIEQRVRARDKYIGATFVAFMGVAVAWAWTKVFG